MQDIRLEKFLELFYDHMRANLDCELKDICPAIRELGELLIMSKESKNEEFGAAVGAGEEWRVEVPVRELRFTLFLYLPRRMLVNQSRIV